MKIRLDLDKAEAAKAKLLGLRLYPNRDGGGGRIYIDDPDEAVEIISKIRGKASK